MNSQAVAAPGGLNSVDLEMFEKIRVPLELLERAGVCRVTDAQARNVYGCELKRISGADMSGIVFPYRDPITGNRVSARVRRDKPECKPDGRPDNKYVSAYGDNRHLYFPPGAGELLADTTVLVVFAESQKAALALTAWARRRGVRLLAIATGGCYGWCGKTGITSGPDGGREETRGPLPDFNLVTWTGREVVIAFDSNAQTNPKVQEARAKLALHLTSLGGRGRIGTVPAMLPEVNGPDDLIAVAGDEAFAAVLSEAEPFSHSKHLPRFCVKSKGTFAIEYKDGAEQHIWLASPVRVEAHTRDDHGNNWGRLLKWHDPEGREHTWAMPMECLGSSEGTEVFRRLLAEGMKVASGRKERARLLEYLQDAIPPRAMTSVSRVGWHDHAFVLPDEVMGCNGAGAMYQSPNEQEHHYREKGTLADWQEHIARYCVGNSRLVFAVSAAFAGPLMAVCAEESGGFHFRGPSSTGKSTVQLVAGSVWGGGGPHGFGHTWRATANGLEAIAELHNDGLLSLDEIGQLDAREAGEVAYLLANGVGKARMTKSIGSRRSLRWRQILLSSGELSLAAHMQNAGKTIRAGQEVRLLDIVADAGAGLGLFERLQNVRSGDEFSRVLSENAKKFYGTAIRPFLSFVAGHWSEIAQSLKQERCAFCQKHVPPGAVGEVSRAAGRFALVGAAGELATEAGITGWADGEAREAVARMFTEWLAQRTIGPADEEAAIRQVRAFIEAHGASRFQSLRPDNSVERIINRAGFKRETEGGTEFLILPEAFQDEVCRGYDPKLVAAALQRRGLLRCSAGRFQLKVRLPELGTDKPVWVYCVNSGLFVADE